MMIAALAGSCALPAYVVRSDAETAHMRGGVARLTETNFDFPADRPDSLELNSVTVLDYNRAGNITLTNVFKGTDSVHVSREEYFYDPSGRRMVRSVSHDPVKHSYNTSLYGYDAQERLINHSDEIFGWHVDYGYDRRGYLKKRVDTTNLKAPIVTRYRYDRLGRLRLEKAVRGGEPSKIYAYHGDTGMIAEIRTGKSDIDRYDERGNLVSSTAIVTRRSAEKTKRHPLGRVVERMPVTITAEYEYDTLGNWIRRTQFYNGKRVGVAVREIDYYGGGEE